MKITTHACDICGIHKQDANHWWKAYRLMEGVTLLPWDAEEPAVYVGDAPADLCGAAHVVEWLSKNILETKL